MCRQQMNDRLQFAQAPNQIRQTEAGGARNQQTHDKTEQCRREKARSKEPEEQHRRYAAHAQQA